MRLLRRQIGDRRLFANNEIKLGDQVHDELAVRAKRLQQNADATAPVRLTLAQNLPDQTLKGLRHRRIGDVALVLVEFARGKKPRGGTKDLVQLVHHRGLADAGIARNEHQFGLPVATT